MLLHETSYFFSGKDSCDYIVEIEIYYSTNIALFPDGVNATFKLFRVTMEGSKTLIYLIDNHAPYGFHEHDKLPQYPESRKSIHVQNWQDAWHKFQVKCQEFLK